MCPPDLLRDSSPGEDRRWCPRISERTACFLQEVTRQCNRDHLRRRGADDKREPNLLRLVMPQTPDFRLARSCLDLRRGMDRVAVGDSAKGVDALFRKLLRHPFEL